MSISSDERDNVTSLTPLEPTAPPQSSNLIRDYRFAKELDALKAVRSFLIEQGESLTAAPPDALSLYELNLLDYSPRGRLPTLDEWQILERLTQFLFGHLSDSLRRRFRYSRLPWWIVYMAIGLGGVAIGSLVLCTLVWGTGTFSRIVPWYVVWLASLGGIGSISFIGMNALSVQDDATFDLLNTKLLVLRISLGALFGVVLALPYGFNSYVAFIEFLTKGGDVSSNNALTLQSLLLLLPFVLGFSTSLVIMILNQLVEAVQSFFGRKASPAPGRGKQDSQERKAP